MAKDEEILMELKKISSLLEPKPPPPKPKNFFDEFKRFIEDYKVMGLAVAFIMGVYVGLLVQALVGDIIMPLVNLFLPNIPWEEITVGPFRIGHFLGELVTFLIIAFVVFGLVKISARIGIK